MGVKGDKSVLFHQLMAQLNKDAKEKTSRTITTDSEKERIQQMTASVNMALLDSIAKQDFVSANVLTHVVSEVAVTVMKLNFDMWNIDEVQQLFALIKEKWQIVKTKEINYK